MFICLKQTQSNPTSGISKLCIGWTAAQCINITCSLISLTVKSIAFKTTTEWIRQQNNFTVTIKQYQFARLLWSETKGSLRLLWTAGVQVWCLCWSHLEDDLLSLVWHPLWKKKKKKRRNMKTNAFTNDLTPMQARELLWSH